MSAEGFFGPSEQSLVDMIQMWGLNNTTGILFVTSGQEEGEVHFDGGNAVWAKAGPYLTNEDAVYHILALKEGKFRFVNTNHVEKSDGWVASYQQMIMEGMRRLDHINDDMRGIEEKFGLIPHIIKEQADGDVADSDATEAEKVFLGLVDGKRNLEKLFNCCGLGVYKRVEVFSKLLSDGIIGMRKVRVLVVDDQKMWREIISNMLIKEPCFEIVGTAEDGIDALKQLSELKPDVMTLDLEMPRLNGLKTLYWMMSGGYDIVLKSHYDIDVEDTYRCPVVVISAIATKMADETLEALMGGASGYITKPSQVVTESLEEQQQRIAKTVLMASQVDLSKSKRIKARDVDEKKPLSDKSTNKMICTAASVVGGLTSLMQLVPGIPADLDASLFVVIDDLESVEHARSFAEFLDRHSELSVFVADKNSILKRGAVYISPGNQQVRFGVTQTKQTAFKLGSYEESGGSGDKVSRPIDDMLVSAVRCKGFEKRLGLVLAGDGSDGKIGFLDMVKLGGKVFAQDSYSSLNPVKPENVAGMGIAKVVQLGDMVKNIVDDIGLTTD